MLDQDIKSQLTTVFGALVQSIDLIYDLSEHEKQIELVAMLEDIASTSSKIKAKPSGLKSECPKFWIERNGLPTGVSFRGIPGGHEFTSLILAILNSDGKGKLLDEGMVARIQGLKGPIRIKTYISLTCENCPDVVQALNQMALIHKDFQHEMVDGGYAQNEVESIGIQGVPSVVVNSKMIHSGRIHFLDLLVKLEEVFGTDATEKKRGNANLGHFDVVVIGGGPAGASAAIYSARKGLKTALIAERLGGQVQDTKGIENLISVIYTEGPQLSEQLYKHVSSYPVKIYDQRRVKSLSKDKTLLLESGETISGSSIIITTGAKWRELGVPGERDYIGRGVAYCPHCDGPFYKGKKIAVIGGGNSGVEAAIDLAGIAGEVVVFEYNDTLKADGILVDKLNSLKNVSVITNARTSELIGNGQKITELQYIDRKSEKGIRVPIEGVFVQIGLNPNSGFAKNVLELTKFGEIIVDAKGHTNVPGIYAAGDVTTTPFKQIIIAMGEGAKVALAAFEDRMYASH
jgi:NADH-dependent peroxiredoxin subunit F